MKAGEQQSHKPDLFFNFRVEHIHPYCLECSVAMRADFDWGRKAVASSFKVIRATTRRAMRI